MEFLLVQTRSGRWIFPKGSAEPGLTHAQAAALEAFEEAGVHGRMEETPFTRYFRRKGGGGNSSGVELTVSVHLCEVLWLDSPQEMDRNPTWFSVEKAKRRLREGRASLYGSELTQVIDHAAMRIRRMRYGATKVVDSLQKVTFIDARIETPRRARRKDKFA